MKSKCYIKDTYRKQSKRTNVNSVMSITLNVTGLNNPIKKQKLSDWI